jgi:hypothetical protein
VPEEEAKNDTSKSMEAPVQDVEENQENLEDTLGRLIIEDERSRYVSGSAWANLADQVSLNFFAKEN